MVGVGGRSDLDGEMSLMHGTDCILVWHKERVGMSDVLGCRVVPARMGRLDAGQLVDMDRLYLQDPLTRPVGCGSSKHVF